jgi:hypothetical protein
MWFDIYIVDTENNGIYNYLLRGQHENKEYYLAYSTKAVLPKRFIWHGVLLCHPARGKYGPINICVSEKQDKQE